jgi:GT2 family glycosyltransferase
LSPNALNSQHVVTAVIVGHDGAAWLAHGIEALQEQTRPVQRIVAVDTGSRDRSGAVLTGKLGQGAVFGMERSTGYAAAVRRALQHKAANGPVQVADASASLGSAGLGAAGQGRNRPSEQVEWIWLLHDDCEPAPDALEQLLRGAAETPTAAILGPKLRDWTDRDVILEAGLGLDTVGRRITGIEPREVDQGQHDGDRDVLGVSSAGMLVRRDVWDQVGGFDPGMTLFGEDIDLCWRVHAAGFRVRVITDAVVYHVMAATKGRRAISVGRRARLLQRRHALQTLLGNLPAGPMLLSLVANLTISLLRTMFYTVAKRGTAALDEAAAVAAVVGHPVRFAAARNRRARGRRSAYARVRTDLPPGHSVRRAAEFVALVLSRDAVAQHASGHSAIDDPTDDDSLLTDTGFLQRFITRPGVMLMIGLIIVAGVAERSLLGSGPLGGGALVPAWEGASTLWGEVLRAYHPSGVGSASAAPPYAAFVALLATILLGKVWLAIDVLLLGAVPLAGLTALLALRKVTKSPRVQVWAAASYALLPVAFGAVAAGRLGSAVAFALIPLIGLQAGRVFSPAPRQARRAAWATGLCLAVGTAFVPLLWPMAVVGVLIAAAFLPASRSRLINLGIVAATPLVLLLPWMLEQLSHPSALMLEAGVQQPGLAATDLPARSLLLLSPGGPGLPPYWVSAALLLTGLAALLATRRRPLVMAGWCVALLGYATAVLVSRMVVTPAGGQQMTPWPGVALAVAAAGLLLAAAAGAEDLGRTVTARGRQARRRVGGIRGFGVVVLSLAAVSAPLLAAAYWLVDGISGPITQASGEVVPALAAPASAAASQLRTLVLTSSGDGHVSYVLLRGDSPELTDSGVVPVTAAQTALSQAVGALVAPGGDDAASQAQLLAHFDIGFVLMRAPLNAGLVGVLDEVAGLSPISMTPTFDLWRVTPTPSRVSVVEPDGTVVAVPSGAIGVSGAAAPSAGGILELAEPAGGWSATLNGHALTPVASPAGGWAQAFSLPAGGGTLAIGRNGTVHDLVTALELLAFLVVGALALPGVKTAAELQAEAATDAEAEEASDELPEPEPVLAAAAAAAAVARRGRSSRPGRAGRGGAGRSGAGRSAAGRRGKVPDAERDGLPEPVAGRGAGKRVRNGAGRAAAGLADGGKVAGRRARGGLPGTSGAGDGAGAAGAVAGGAAMGAAERLASGRTAWPAGQPASRFLSGPPSVPYQAGDLPGPVRDDRRGPGGPSPSSYPYDDPPPGAAEPRPPYSGRRAAPPSPSGSPYNEERVRREDAERGQPSGRGRQRPSGHRRGQPQPASGWATEEPPSWQPGSRASSWPESGPEHGWPQEREPDRRPDYPEHSEYPDYPGASVPRQAPAHSVPDQAGWPEEGDSLEALPPIAEMHHDWSGPRERTRGNWLAPEEETDGDTW